MAGWHRKYALAGAVSAGLLLPLPAALSGQKPGRPKAMTARAQDPPAESGAVSSIPEHDALTLGFLEALAIQNNPTLAQAAAAIDMARGQLRQVGLYPNPQLGYLRSDSSPSGRFRSDGVFVGQEIVTAGKL